MARGHGTIAIRVGNRAGRARGASAAEPGQENLDGQHQVSLGPGERLLKDLLARLGEELDNLGKFVQVGSAESGDRVVRERTGTCLVRYVDEH